jgi:hypothetical protein
MKYCGLREAFYKIKKLLLQVGSGIHEYGNRTRKTTQKQRFTQLRLDKFDLN